MITIGICDDEANMRRKLRELLEKRMQLSGQEYTIAEFSCGEALLANTGLKGLDILFLDIEMRSVNGIETARRLRDKGSRAILIFVTAYPDFVFQGYEVHAFHYILKPYEEKKIAEVLCAAIAELETNKERFFVVQTKSGISRIPYSRITAFFSNARKITVMTSDEETEFYTYGIYPDNNKALL